MRQIFDPDLKIDCIYNFLMADSESNVLIVYGQGGDSKTWSTNVALNRFTTLKPKAHVNTIVLDNPCVIVTTETSVKMIMHTNEWTEYHDWLKAQFNATIIQFVKI